MRSLFRLAGREPGVDREVEDELATHLAMKTDALIREGWSPVEAAGEAARQFGSRAAIERRTRIEAARTRRRKRWGDRGGAWLMDLKLAFRSLARAPGYTLLATVILTLGIGAAVAVIGIADRMLLSPLPLAEPERITVLLETGAAGGVRVPSYPTVQDWQRLARSFEGIAYLPGTQVLWRSPSGAESLGVAYPSPGFFRVAGVHPLLGRGFTAEDEASGHRVAVISHRLWERRFGSDPGVVGAVLSLADGPVTVVGVMPLGFQVPAWADAYLPLSTMSAEGQRTIALRGSHADALAIGRLRPDADPKEATLELGVIAEQLAREYPVEQGEWRGARLLPIRDFIADPAAFTGQGLRNPERTVLVFAAGVILVLLIACANVAGLTLVKGQGRKRELAIRAALGAGRWQLARQRLLESALLAAAGALLGISLAAGLLETVKRTAPDLIPRLQEARLDPRLVGIAVAIAAIATLLSGLLPALRATPGAVADLVKAGGRGTGSKAQTAVQRGLVTLQLGLAVMLLVGSALLLRSFVRVVETPVGFDAERVVSVTINPDRARYPNAASTVELYRRLLEAAARVPGVESAALSNHLPISGASLPTRLEVEGQEPVEGAVPTALFRTVSPEYFETMGIRVRRGRVFEETDLAAPNDGLVVNEALARRHWPGQDPLGRRITVYRSARWLPDFGEPITGVVIGVVGDVRHFGSENGVTAEVYLPYTWNPWAWTGLVVRTRDRPDAVIDRLWNALGAVDPELPVMTGSRRNIAAFETLLKADRGPRRLMTSIAVGVAATALLLAVAGLYGLMSFLVNLRSRELGIRGALGAGQGEILRLVMEQGLALTVIGIGAGLFGGWLVASSLESLVFGVSVRDLAAYAVVPAVLLVVSAVAIYLPARRAARLDPVAVLRAE